MEIIHQFCYLLSALSADTKWATFCKWNFQTDMTIIAFWFIFHWNIFPKVHLTIINHCLTQWGWVMHIYIYESLNYPSLVQIMACCLVGTKPLSGPMLEYCLLYPWEQTSVEFQSEFKHFHSRKCIWKCRLQNGVYFVSASMCLGSVLKRQQIASNIIGLFY